VGGKSILSQFLEPYRKMYQRGGLVDTGTQVSPPMEQPSDTTNTYGGGTMPGMDFTFGGGDFVNPNIGGGLEYTQPTTTQSTQSRTNWSSPGSVTLPYGPFPDYGESGPGIFGNPLDFSVLVDDPAQDDPVQNTLSYMGVSGGPGGAQGPLGMETAPGYMPGKFIGRKVRRAPALGMGVQDTEQRQDSRSDIIDAVLNELRI
jgi:hypothetical protein